MPIKRSLNMLKTLRGTPELVVATVGEPDAVRMFPDTPIYSDLITTPRNSDLYRHLRGVGRVQIVQPEVRKLYHSRASALSPNSIELG